MISRRILFSVLFVVLGVVSLIIGACLVGIGVSQYGIASSSENLFLTECSIERGEVQSYTSFRSDHYETKYRALFRVHYEDAEGSSKTDMAATLDMASWNFENSDVKPNEQLELYPNGTTTPCWASISPETFETVMKAADGLHLVAQKHFAFLQLSQEEWDSMQSKYQLMLGFGIAFFVIFVVSMVGLIVVQVYFRYN